MVEAYRRGNFYPTKVRPEQKVDAAVALMMAIGRARDTPVQATSIFDHPELWTEWPATFGEA